MDNEDQFIEEIGESYLGAKLKARSEARGRIEGKSESMAEGLLYILSERGLPMTEDQRQRILSCRDLPLLDTW